MNNLEARDVFIMLDTSAGVRRERLRQIDLGWTPAHDDEHDLEHLYELIRQRINRPAPMTLSVAENTLREVAALAHAGLESITRKRLRSEETS